MKKNKTVSKLQKSLLQKVAKRVSEEKSLLAKSMFEAPEADVLGKDAEPELDTSKLKDVKFTVYKSGGNIYKVRFPFMGRMYVVEFTPDAHNPTQYNSTFYVQNMKNSDKVAQRFGITAVSQIEPLFGLIIKAVKKFLTLRKPTVLRFLPGGEAGSLPSSFYVFTYKPLKQFQQDLDEFKPSYSISRGTDSSKAAFVLYRGGGKKILKTQSWRPKKEPIAAPATEQFKKVVSNDAVAGSESYKPKKSSKLREAPVMRLRKLGPQETEVETPDHKILFSYEVPVAYFDKKDNKFYRSKVKYSTTTSRHVNKWLKGKDAEERDQAVIDKLLK